MDRRSPDAYREPRHRPRVAQNPRPTAVDLGFAISWVMEVVAMVSARGGKYGFVYKSRQNVYRALRRKGMTKKAAARISNGGRFHAQRVAMSRKGAAKRKAKGRRR
jgi:hypothetical protein